MSSVCMPKLFDWKEGQTLICDYISMEKPCSTPHTHNKESYSDIERRMEDGSWRLDLEVLPNNLVILSDTHCPDCGCSLIKNGTNPKIQYEEESRERKEYSLQRYSCDRCGEIQIDYSSFFIDHGKYEEDIKKEVRLAFSLGNTPSLIQKLIIVFLKWIIPLSTIKSWIVPMHKPLKKVLYPRNMPCSGSIGIDEIHLRMEGEKAYLQTSVDNLYRFVLRAEYTKELDKYTIKKHINGLRLEQNLSINSVVHDGLPKYGSAFKMRGLDTITRGTCHTHFKKNIRTVIYEVAGLGKQFKKLLPPKFFVLLHKFYWLIGSTTEFRFMWRLEAIRSLVDILDHSKLHKLLNKIASKQELLQAHLKTPYLAKNTSIVESINHEIEQYPGFKKNLKTITGVELVANSRIYYHNIREFSRVWDILEKEKEYWIHQYELFGYCSHVRSGKIRLGHLKKKVRTYEEELNEFWMEYFPNETLSLFKKLWGVHH